MYAHGDGCCRRLTVIECVSRVRFIHFDYMKQESKPNNIMGSLLVSISLVASEEMHDLLSEQGWPNKAVMSLKKKTLPLSEAACVETFYISYEGRVNSVLCPVKCG